MDVRMKVYPGLTHGFNVGLAGGEAAKKHLRDMMKGMGWLLERGGEWESEVVVVSDCLRSGQVSERER